MRSKPSKGPMLRQAQANLQAQVAAGLPQAAADAELARLGGLNRNQIAAGNAAAMRPPMPPAAPQSPAPMPPDMEQFPTVSQRPMMPFPPRGQNKFPMNGMQEQPLQMDPAMMARLTGALQGGQQQQNQLNGPMLGQQQPNTMGMPPMGPGSPSAFGQQQNQLNGPMGGWGPMQQQNTMGGPSMNGGGFGSMPMNKPMKFGY